MPESGPVDPTVAGPGEHLAPDPAPLPNWSEPWAVRASSPVLPATPAPIVAASPPRPSPVPPLLIRRQLQLIETYEAHPGREASPQLPPIGLHSAGVAEASPAPMEIAADAIVSSDITAHSASEASAPTSGAMQAGGSATNANAETPEIAKTVAPSAQAEPAAADPEKAELLHELEVTRSELAELSQLVEELPAIFERKFRQRLEPILEEQQRLQADNTRLRQQLEALPGSGGLGRPLLLPHLREPGGAPARRQARGLGGIFRRAFGLSDRDDGRTTAA